MAEAKTELPGPGGGGFGDRFETASPPRVARRLMLGPVAIEPPLFQAPMAGFTNYAYRQMVRQFGGVGLLATEMVCARSFVWQDVCPADPPERLWGVLDEPRPLAVQIWDNDPQILAQAGARLAEEFRVSVVDLNFGCPVPRVAQRAQSGSYLLKDPERVGRLVECVVRACHPTPVTAKIRLGCRPDQITGGQVAEAVEQAGAAALTVHGRTAQDLFRGQADWERIAAVKSHLRRIPLIGNGDLDSPAKAVAAFRQYPVDGLMIGRAALGRPWLFRQIQAALQGQTVPEEPAGPQQRQLLLLHFERVLQRFGPEKGTMLMRKYACCYAQGLRGARQFRGQVARVASPDDFRDVVAHAFPRGGSKIGETESLQNKDAQTGRYCS